MKKKITSILLADDHKMIVDGLKLLFSCNTSCFFEAYRLDTAIEIACREKPELAIVDFRLGRDTGDVLVRELKYHSPATRILGYSYSADKESILKLADAGIHGFILKGDSDTELLHAADELLQGNLYFDALSRNYLTARLHCRHAGQDDQLFGNIPLTSQEISIIRLICGEFNAREISKQVFLSERTVEEYRSRILRKIGAKNIIGVIKFALRHSLITNEDL